MPELETERLVLRAFTESDWDALNGIWADPAVTRFMHFRTWDAAKRGGAFQSLLRETSNPNRTATHWAITLRSDGQLIGWLVIGNSRHALDGTRECGYALHPGFWGRGYMAEALRAAFAYEFTVLRSPRIVAECETENIASSRVMQKSGMEYEGTFFDADFEGNWAHRHRYRILNPASAGT